jgi:hypothetical protein
VEQRDPSSQHDSHVFVLALRCIECNRRWDDPGERWRVYFTDDDPPEPATYCPACAWVEFND